MFKWLKIRTNRYLVTFVFGIVLPAFVLSIFSIRSIKYEQIMISRSQEKKCLELAQLAINSIENNISIIEKELIRSVQLYINQPDFYWTIYECEDSTPLVKSFFFINSKGRFVYPFELEQGFVFSAIYPFTLEMELKQLLMQEFSMEPSVNPVQGYKRLFESSSDPRIKMACLWGAARFCFRIKDFQKALVYYNRCLMFNDENPGIIHYSYLKNLHLQKAITLVKLGFRTEGAKELLLLYSDLISSPNAPGFELYYLGNKCKEHLYTLIEEIKNPAFLAKAGKTFMSLNRKFDVILNSQNLVRELKGTIPQPHEFIYFKRETENPVVYRDFDRQFYGIIHKSLLPSGMFGGFVIEKHLFLEKVLGPALEPFEDHMYSITSGGDIIYARGDSEGRTLGLSVALGNRFHFLNLNMYHSAELTLIQLIKRKDILYIGTILILILIIMVGGRLVYTGLRREMDLVRAKSTFISGVSHELKTPLTSIRLYGEMLESGKIASERKKTEYYKIITKESERLTKMINQVLDYTKIEEGKMMLDIKAWDLGAIVKIVLGIFEPRFNELGAEIKTSVSSGCVVQCDKGALIQVFSNLVDNALKYTDKERPRIDLRVKQEDRTTVMEIEDNGIGIPRDSQDKIFENFYRGDNEITRKKGGTGIGLAIVRRIIEAHGWTITLSSRPGTGSLFRIICK
jgi:signal transduction histidine kinase